MINRCRVDICIQYCWPKYRYVRELLSSYYDNIVVIDNAAVTIMSVDNVYKLAEGRDEEINNK